ncbi:exodeoxyribonuclease VII small subunit [bacterium]|nr:exodeoxyribonuclease VII small subunit [bacterium]
MNRLDFESQFDKLNACVADLESGRLSLDESLNAYRTGIELVSRCREILEQAQARVASIESLDESGEPRTAPLDLEVESHAALRKPETISSPDDEPF